MTVHNTPGRNPLTTHSHGFLRAGRGVRMWDGGEGTIM